MGLMGRCSGVAGDRQNPTTGCDRLADLPVEHVGVAVFLTPYAEIIEGRTIRVGHENFRNACLHPVLHEIV
jgi:hypothetical protein